MQKTSPFDKICDKNVKRGMFVSVKSQLLRAKILHEFNDLIYENGYNNTTLRQLAERCGISRGHLYFYFKKKEELQTALSEDLYGKIQLILDNMLTTEDDALKRFLILHLMVNYLFSEKQELYRISAECAEHIEIMDGKASLTCKALYKSFKDIGISFEMDVLKPACACAVSGEYAYIRCLYQNGKPLDYLALFHLFAEILFHQLQFAKGSTYIGDCITWFQNQDQGRLMQTIYEMDAYNYTFEGEVEG